MPEYLSPGVYVEEISPGSRPIEGVSTSTAGFVGQTERGPTIPRLVTSWLDFQRWFGGHAGPALSFLPYAIQGFFDNSGQRAFLARVTRSNAVAARLDLVADGVRVSGTAAAPASATVLTGAGGVDFVASGVVVGDIVWNATDRSRGTVTAVTATTVTVAALAGGANNAFAVGDAYVVGSATTQVRIIVAAAAPTTALTAAAGVDFVASGVVAGDIVRNITDGSQGAVTAVTTTTVLVDALVGGANNAIAAGDAYVIANQIRSADAAAAPASPTVLTAAAGVDFLASGVAVGDVVMNVTDGSQGVVNVVTAATVTVAALAGGANNAFAVGDAYVIANQIRIAGIAAPVSPLVLGAAAGVDFVASGVAVGDIVRNVTDGCRGRVTAVSTTAVVVDALTGGTNNTFAAGNVCFITRGQSLRAEAIGRGAWGNRLFIWVRSGSRSGFRLTILYYLRQPPLPLVNPTDPNNIANPNRREPDILEDYDNLGVDPTGPSYVLTTVNGASRLVHLEWADLTRPLVRPQNARFSQLANGADGVAALSATQFIGDPTVPTNQREGLAGLEVIDEISLLCIPDQVHPSLNAVNQTQIMNEMVSQCERLRDRFAVLQVEAGQGNVTTIQPPRDTSYAAIYYPWIRVFDTLTQDTVLIPPGGHVTGIYARTDVERGVHKAPANENVRGIITIDLNSNRGPLEFKVTKGQHDLLNPRGIDVIRDFRADRRGIRVWGARTMSSDPQWKYVNVRRLFLFVEESIDEGTQWVVFEPNDEPTWAKVRRSITNFLISVWRSGALMGATQDEAFFVKCDRTTMTQDDIDNGRLICFIGIAPVKPAEFVIFRISQKTMEAAA